MVTLRNSNSNDLNYILEAEASASSHAFVINWSKERHLQVIEDPKWDHMVIESDRPVGYFIGRRQEDNYELMRIVISEKSKGYGSTTIKTLLKEKFEKGIHRFWLDVRMHNKHAINLYEKLGFVEEAILRDAVKLNKAYVDVKVMSILRSDYEI